MYYILVEILDYAYFLARYLTSSQYVVADKVEPSASPLGGSLTTKMSNKTAMAPKIGVTRSPHCQEPNALAISAPTMNPRPLLPGNMSITSNSLPFGSYNVLPSYWNSKVINNEVVGASIADANVGDDCGRDGRKHGFSYANHNSCNQENSVRVSKRATQCRKTPKCDAECHDESVCLFIYFH